MVEESRIASWSANRRRIDTDYGEKRGIVGIATDKSGKKGLS